MEIFNLKDVYFYHYTKDLTFNSLLKKVESCYEFLDKFEDKIDVQSTLWKLEHHFPIRVVTLSYNDKNYIIKGGNDINNFREFVNSSNIYTYFDELFDVSSISKSKKLSIMNNHKVEIVEIYISKDVEWDDKLTKELLNLI